MNFFMQSVGAFVLYAGNESGSPKEVENVAAFLHGLNPIIARGPLISGGSGFSLNSHYAVFLQEKVKQISPRGCTQMRVVLN